MFVKRIFKNIFNHLSKNKFSKKSIKEASMIFQEYKIGFILYLPFNSVNYLIHAVQIRREILNEILMKHSNNKEGEIFDNAFGEMLELDKLNELLHDHREKIIQTEYFKESRNINSQEIQKFKNLFKINLN